MQFSMNIVAQFISLKELSNENQEWVKGDTIQQGFLQGDGHYFVIVILLSRHLVSCANVFPVSKKL
jgi:hypothetical protein